MITNWVEQRPEKLESFSDHVCTAQGLCLLYTPAIKGVSESLIASPPVGFKGADSRGWPALPEAAGPNLWPGTQWADIFKAQ